jgi:hypothetical protein
VHKTVKPARAVLSVVLLLGAVWFAWRGPLRGAGGGNFDFALIYSSARAWLLGLDPYSMETAQRVFFDAGGPKILEPMTRPESSLVYLPATFVVLAPFAALPWAAANWAWTLANLALLGASLLMVGKLARLGVTGTMAMSASLLWLAPAATGMYVGQMAHVVLFLLVSGELIRRRSLERGDRRWVWAAGALTGLAAIIKPQLGLLFLVYHAGRLRWRCLAAGAMAMAALLALGAIRLEIAGVPWWETWVRHVGEFGTTGDANAAVENTFRYQMVNLAYPIRTFVHDRGQAAVVVYGILGLLSLAYFITDLRNGRERGEGRGELLSLSMTTCVTLLIAYHRTYDAVILAFPLAMAWRGFLSGRHDTEPPAQRSWPRRPEYLLVLILMVPFFAPGAGMLTRAEQQGLIPKEIAGTLLWQGIIVPHATWALVAACVWLIYLRAKTGPPDASAERRVQSTP